MSHDILTFFLKILYSYIRQKSLNFTASFGEWGFKLAEYIFLLNSPYNSLVIYLFGFTTKFRTRKLSLSRKQPQQEYLRYKHPRMISKSKNWLCLIRKVNCRRFPGLSYFLFSRNGFPGVHLISGVLPGVVATLTW